MSFICLYYGCHMVCVFDMSIACPFDVISMSKIAYFCIVCPWIDHNMAFCHRWLLYGFYMDINLTSYGISMTYLKWCSLYRHDMDALWICYDLCMFYIWFLYGQTMIVFFAFSDVFSCYIWYNESIENEFVNRRLRYELFYEARDDADD